MERKVRFQKRFRWFYTFLDYKETYHKLFDQPSLTNYLDSTHYSYVMLPDEEKEKYLKENFDTTEAKRFDKEAEIGLWKWLEFTIINSGLEAIEKSVDNVEGWPLSKSEFLNKKDSIINLIDGRESLFDDEDGDLWEILETVFGIDSNMLCKLEQKDAFAEFKEKYLFWEDIFLENEYTNIIEMPGLIIETSSNEINENNEVEWNVVGWMHYFTDDYEMYVQSRIINRWAFWVSGVFILFLGLILVFRRKKNKKNNTI